MEHMQDEAVESFERLLDSMDANGIRNIIVFILEALKNDAGVFLLFKNQGQSDAFLHKLVGCCYRCMEKWISDIPGLAPAPIFSGKSGATTAKKQRYPRLESRGFFMQRRKAMFL